MAQLSQEEVRRIIDAAPLGTSKAGILAGLRARGHTFEGYDSGPQLQALPPLGKRLRNRALAALPAAYGAFGSLAGGMVGAPMQGAGLGGSLGEFTKELGAKQRLNPVAIASQGGQQAALEGLGQIGGRFAGKIGRSFIPKTVTFQKPETPSVILNEFGKPFMIPGQTVTFQKGATKGAKHAADVALDLASHGVPGGALIRPMIRGLRNKMSSAGSPLGNWLTSPGAQLFARHFPRAAAALIQLSNYEDQPDSTAGP